MVRGNYLSFASINANPKLVFSRISLVELFTDIERNAAIAVIEEPIDPLNLALNYTAIEV